MAEAEVRNFVIGYIGAIIGIAVGIALLPVINTTIAEANLQGIQAAMAGLLPILTAVGVVLFAVKIFF